MASIPEFPQRCQAPPGSMPGLAEQPRASFLLFLQRVEAETTVAHRGLDVVCRDAGAIEQFVVHPKRLGILPGVMTTNGVFERQLVGIHVPLDEKAVRRIGGFRINAREQIAGVVLLALAIVPDEKVQRLELRWIEFISCEQGFEDFAPADAEHLPQARNLIERVPGFLSPSAGRSSAPVRLERLFE